MAGCFWCRGFLLFLLCLFGAGGTIAHAQTQPNVITVNNAGNVNRDMKIPSGRQVTIKSGGALSIESGATVTGLSAAIGNGFVTIDGVRTSGVPSGGTQLSNEARFVTFQSTGETVSGDQRLMRLPYAANVPAGQVIFYADLYNNDGPVGNPYLALGIQSTNFLNGGGAGSGITLARRGHWWSFQSDGVNSWTARDLGSLGPGGTTGSGAGGPANFADDAARAAAAPLHIGQLGLQLSDRSLWGSNSTGAGDWEGDFTLRAIAGQDATLLRLVTPFNSSTGTPLLSLEATDLGFFGPLIAVSNDNGQVAHIDSVGDVFGNGFWFEGDTNTGIHYRGADEFALNTGGTDRVIVKNAYTQIDHDVQLNGSLTVTSITGGFALEKTITAGGTTGAQTINKNAGTVNFAASATSLVVTDSRVTANSVIVATVGTNDTTMKSVQAVAASGSFTLYPNAAPTAETRVNFLVIN
jgi:hypothetical protein